MGNILSLLFGQRSVEYQPILSEDDTVALAKVNKTFSLNDQTREICSKDHIRISNKLKSDQLITSYYPDVQTLYDGFLRGCRVAGNKPCIGYRPNLKSPYKWLTYNEVKTRAENFGAGLVGLCGCKGDNSQMLGIYARNMVEWVIGEKGSLMYSMVLIPLYNTLGDQAMRWIAQQTEMEIMIIENGKALAEFERDVFNHPEGKFVKKVVLIQKTAEDAELIARVEAMGKTIYDFDDVEKYGQENPLPHNPPKGDDLAVINYTSGTTGNPKGVMLTHLNLVADASAANYMLPRIMNSEDSWFSYLPLPHVFERMVQVALFQVGARIGFSSGDIRAMPSDLGALKPTIFGGVPRVWTRFYDKILNAGAGSMVKSTLVNMALKSKVAEVEAGICRKDSIWDKIVFKKVQALLGGNVTMAVTGAAPIAPEILNVLRAAFGCCIVEGYGQTECAAACSGTMPGDHTGSVGAPLVCNQIRLDSVEEMNYHASEGKGEICIRGPNVMKGYFRNDEKTAETIDENGWLHTGDIGTWTESGSLRIIDRKKNIFKLAQGEYIAPEKIENVYIQATPVMQVFVHGDSLEATLVAIVVVDPESFVGWCTENGLSGGDLQTLCKRADVKKAVLDDMNKIGKKATLRGFELARNIHLECEPWTVEADLLTPTFKSKRPQLKNYYQAEINQMYNK